MQQRVAFARAGDPLTSKEAAARVTKTLTTRERQVLAALEHGPGTCREIAERLRMGRDSISPRMGPLEAAGRVERTGERRDRQAVWSLPR